MKEIKKILPIFLFIAMMSLNTTVFASQLYQMTLSVGRGKTVQTSKYDMPSGIARIGFRISKINGSSNKNDANSTKLHLIMRDSNDTAILDTYRDINQDYIGGTTMATGTINGAKGNWYAQVSTKVNGINYASFYSDHFNLISLTS